MHTVEGFYDAKRELQASLKSGAKPIMEALVQAYKALLANPSSIPRLISATATITFIRSISTTNSCTAYNRNFRASRRSSPCTFF
jgi:hypothetical protein